MWSWREYLQASPTLTSGSGNRSATGGGADDSVVVYLMEYVVMGDSTELDSKAFENLGW